jgi:hypothetical protein
VLSHQYVRDSASLKQELVTVDLNAGLDPNSSGEWLPRVVLDFIEVSLLLFDLDTHIGLLDYRRNISFAVIVPLTI